MFLVSGEITCDEYLIDKENFNLIKRTKGSDKIIGINILLNFKE